MRIRDVGDKSVLGLIMARGGSKDLPHKNLRQIGGKPMVVWTVEAGKQSQCIDRLIISSEDEEIIDTALQLDAKYQEFALSTLIQKSI
jgi:CMP-N,N'-diacetyllegionaminic acid synthase